MIVDRSINKIGTSYAKAIITMVKRSDYIVSQYDAANCLSLFFSFIPFSVIFNHDLAISVI